MTVGIIIPTLNSERCFEACLESISRQTFKDWEVVVVDSNSSDRTREIGARYGSVIAQDCSTARARLIGAEACNAEFILNVDSDQMLRPTTLERVIETGAPIVALGEDSIPSGILGRINALDKRITGRNFSQNIDPVYGTILPRFYERKRLLESLRKIPPELIDIRPSYLEDALTFLGALKPTERVAYVPNCILHHEMESTLDYFHKWKRYGTTAKAYRGTPYEFIISQRGVRRGTILDRIACLPALALRSIPFALGYYS